MKVLYSITKSSEGGAQTHVLQLCLHLRKDNTPCAIMAAPGGWLEEQAHKHGILFFPNPYFANSFNPLTLIKAMRRIRKVIRAYNPDLISTHSGFAGLATRITIRNYIPTIHTAHGWSFSPGVPKKQQLITTIAERIAARWCKTIICVSEFDRTLAIQKRIAPAKKLITIHNGVEIPTEPPQPKKTIKDIVFLGRLAEPKQPELLLTFARELTDTERSEIHITIVGDGPKYTLLSEAITRYDLKDCITLLGYQPREKVVGILATMDLLVLPSRKEGFPRSILEAMSLGVPVAASDVGGVSEVVSDGVGTLLPQNGAVAALLSYVRSMRAATDIYTAQSREAAARIKHSFSLDRMYAHTMDCYTHTISASQ